MINFNEINIYDIIGYTAVIFSVLGFLTNNRNKMLIYGIISTFLFGISIYFGYGGINGLICSLISIIIKLLSLNLKKDKLFILKIIAPFISILLFFITPEGLEGIIPSLSMFFIIIADSQKNIIKMKYWYYGSNLLWLSYGIILGSIPAIIFDVLGFISITYGIYKLKQEKNEKNIINSGNN